MLLEITIVPLGTIIAKLGILLLASLAVERFLIILSWLINQQRLIFSTDLSQKVNKTSKEDKAKILKEAEWIKTEESVDFEEAISEEIPANPLLKSEKTHSGLLLEEIKSLQTSSNEKEALEVVKKKMRTSKEFWMHFSGIAFAFLACWKLDFSIWDVIYWENKDTQYQAGVSHYLFTAIIIGAGSKPIHFLMNFLIDRKFTSQVISSETAPKEKTDFKKGTQEGNLPPEKHEVLEPAETKSIEELLGFKYDEGDRPDRMENIRIFKRPIDTLVYHHTAMNSASSFEELVRVFDQKGWTTGYHTVVFPDGKIRILCRWDRIGNHAYGVNSRSLGIAMMGNFEMDPDVPFSNHDGRFGRDRPTQAQLNSTAKIISLWSLMHDIPMKILTDKSEVSGRISGIVPHYLIKPKACPGSNFPHKAFINLCETYHKEWSNNEDFMKRLEEFKEIKRVMPKYL